ncbi:hypothetical protein HMPREF3190_00120 [Umbribacter vaginalis]|nr:hypothetical protein HMPREF3190_00120 [Coriobacteriales bacterium DNF00809]
MDEVNDHIVALFLTFTRLPIPAAQKIAQLLFDMAQAGLKGTAHVAHSALWKAGAVGAKHINGIGKEGQVNIKTLTNDEKELVTIPITRADLKQFQKQLKKMGVTFAVVKNPQTGELGIAVKAANLSVIEHAMHDYLEKAQVAQAEQAPVSQQVQAQSTQSQSEKQAQAKKQQEQKSAQSEKQAATQTQREAQSSKGNAKAQEGTWSKPKRAVYHTPDGDINTLLSEKVLLGGLVMQAFSCGVAQIINSKQNVVASNNLSACASIEEVQSACEQLKGAVPQKEYLQRDGAGRLKPPDTSVDPLPSGEKTDFEKKLDSAEVQAHTENKARAKEHTLARDKGLIR